MARLVTPFTLLVFVATACSSPGAPDGPARELELQPRLALDLPMASEDSVLVGSLRDATRLSDGRIVLIDGDRKQMVFVDSTGGVLGTSGREGGGPGEFELPGWTERCAGDSLFVFDLRTGQLSVFDSIGRYARSFRPVAPTAPLMTCDQDGHFAVFDASGVPDLPPDPGEEPPMFMGELVTFSSTGKELQRIPDVPLGKVGMLGSLAAVGMLRNEAIVGVSSSPVLTHYDSIGTRLADDSLPLVSRPISDSLFDAELDRLTNSMGGDSAIRARLRGILDGMYQPPVAPLYQLLRVAPDGTTWLVTSLATDPTTDLLGRLPDGRLARITIPARIEVYEIGNDYLLGTTTGADDEDHLMLYRWESPWQLRPSLNRQSGGPSTRLGTSRP